VTVHAAVRPTRSSRSIGWVPYPLIAIVVVPAIAVVALGLAVAFSALWMTAFYPRIPGGALATPTPNQSS
jgi:hypothetical protein